MYYLRGGYEVCEEEEKTVVVDNTRLNYLEAAMLATITEDVITELRILSECNNKLRIIRTMEDMGTLRALKYQVKQSEVKDELASIDPYNLDCMRYKLEKVGADRKYMTDALIEVYLDLTMNKKYLSLGDCIKKIKERDAHLEFLQKDEPKNKLTRRELTKRLRQQRNHIKSVTYDTDVIIEDLKSRVEDALLNAETRSRYVDKWQRARTEQHIQTIQLIEEPSSEVIKYFRQRSDHEQRVHSEVDVLSTILIDETIEKVEQWMSKYDKDMETMDLKIQIKKHEYQNTNDKRISLEETIEKHDTLMKDWIYFKEEREKTRIYLEKMTNAATCVQAWWRGLLVRLQLGPFKVAKKKGAGAAGRKKK